MLKLWLAQSLNSLDGVLINNVVVAVLFPRLGKSRVIHIRNIPNEASEPEVIQLGVQFGRVSNVLVLKGKNQAFLEMADENSAAAMVACLSANPPQVRGRTVYVQFSNHRELKTDQNHSMAVSDETFNSTFAPCGFLILLSASLLP